ncbi:MAG: XdhC family protein [Desulfobacula sp.]|jgi:xanthine dehydrogenase accessory factor|uniref:XdhC family aldehyde oxidoreductase maturation factor n=1 Tax=Desulfobacula sp. TaxID=2593537 RepID=UPI001D6719EE|nr:XdhC family protein [Desulfobacula sp.]MBT5547031.1 XdhC family protein [Desulfobacula sp.]MBT7051961.1 XdhC family protein [Desulfobacula sp.]MBT7259544.1 XdhC family protein [Desulfobacula sp.]
MEPLNQQILDCIKQSEPFAVATILTHKGSTPRTSGSKMIVLKDQTIYGTIGGGLVEATVMDACLELIDKNQSRIKEFSLNRELKDGLDMVCGGNLIVLMEVFIPDSGLVNIFKALVNLEKEGKKGFLVSKIDGFSKSDFTTRKCLVLTDTTVIGSYLIPKPFMDSICDNKFTGTFPIIYNHGLEEFIIESIHPSDTLYIFGAGHVGFQLAKMAHLTDFQTVVVDDREEFANPERFAHSKEVLVVKKFDNAFDSLSIDKNSYIVILTRGHLHDQTVLEAALETNAAYIGMIGSRAKRNQIYTALKKRGVSDKALEAVYSPIGLEIHAETPAEIAVSIMGEIIKIKAEK